MFKISIGFFIKQSKVIKLNYALYIHMVMTESLKAGFQMNLTNCTLNTRFKLLHENLLLMKVFLYS